MEKDIKLQKELFGNMMVMEIEEYLPKDALEHFLPFECAQKASETG
jgi:hypothetical protein